MRLRRECGVWELFLPGVPAGAKYKFEIRSQGGEVLPARAGVCLLLTSARLPD